MITHHRVGTHVNGEYFGQFEDPGSDPVPPMGEIPPALGIDPTQKLAPHAPGDGMVVRRGVQGDELASRHGHGNVDRFGFEKQARSLSDLTLTCC